MSTLTDDVSGLKGDLADVKAKQIQDFEALYGKLTKVDAKVEHGVVPTLDLVLESPKDIISGMNNLKVL